MATNFKNITQSLEKLAEQIIRIKEDIIATVAHECGVEAARRVGRVHKDITEQRYLEWLKHEEDFKKSLESDGSEYKI